MSHDVKSVLVTGATGFIGHRLCRRLKEDGNQVIALGRSPQEGPWDQFLQCDLSQGIPPEDSLNTVTTVYHLASKAHDFNIKPSRQEYEAVIVKGTENLVNLTRNLGMDQFIYLSSVKAIGDGNPEGSPLAPIDENWPSSPQSPYGCAKLRAEELVLRAGIPHAVILRPTMVYGPGEKGNLQRMREAVRNNRFPPIPENGNRRSMIHVDDLIEYILRSAAEPAASGKTYILSSENAVSTRELYDAIRQSLGMEPVDWAVPIWSLNAVAAIGTLIQSITGRKMPLDGDTLNKLLGSAWYRSISAERDLGYTARRSVLDWLRCHVGD